MEDFTERPPRLKAPVPLPPPAPAAWVRFLVLGAACAVAVLVYVHRLGFARALPTIQNDLGLSNEQVTGLTAAFLVAYGLFEIPCGLLGDRLGVRHLLPLLVLGWSLITACTGFATRLSTAWALPFLYLLALRLLFGMLQAGAFPSLSRMLADWMPPSWRASAQGLIWTSTRVGGMVAPRLLGGLMVLCGNWQTPLVLISSLGLVWCLAFWPWFRNRPEEITRGGPGRELLVSRPPGHGKVPWAKMLRSRSVWALCLTYGFGGFAANFYVTLLPTYLRNQRHLSERETDWLSALPFAFGLVACTAGGLLSDALISRTGNRKWGRRLNGTVGMALGALAWLSITWVPGTVGLAVVLCLIFFCNDMVMGPAWAACADVGERYAGTLGGAMNMTGSLAGALGNLAAGFLFSREFAWHVAGRDFLLQGKDLLFVIYAGSFAMAALCWLQVDVTRTLANDP
jgi:sugar phosphate permease